MSIQSLRVLLAAQGLVADGSPALIRQSPSSHPPRLASLFHAGRMKGTKLAIKMCTPIVSWKDPACVG